MSVIYKHTRNDVISILTKVKEMIEQEEETSYFSGYLRSIDNSLQLLTEEEESEK